MNNFVFEIPDFIDRAYLYTKAKEILTEKWLSTPDPWALADYTDRVFIKVDDDEYLSSIREQHPKLKDYIKILKAETGTWPTHVDKHRVTAINIPLHNYEECDVIFYDNNYTELHEVTTKFGSIEDTWKSNNYLTYVQPKTVLYKHILNNTAIINTNAPHSIENRSNDNRIIASWTYDETFEQAIEDFQCQ